MAKLFPDVQGFGFDITPRAGGEQECRVCGNPSSFGTARGRYPVLPFLRTEERTFWTGLSFRFVPELKDHRLQSVSLVVFEGLASDSEKRPLLRAEWDTWETSHAQPHWHVYRPSSIHGDVLLRYREIIEGTAPIEEFRSEPMRGRVVEKSSMRALELERFHYAMCAGWHDQGDNTHRWPLSESALSKWLEGCLSYTRGQLRYLAG